MKRNVVKTSLQSTPCSIYNKILKGALTSSDLSEREVLLGYLRSRNFTLLLEWAESISPQSYGDASRYYEATQIAALVKKYPFNKDEVPDIDPEAEALKKFIAAEHRCKRVNQRLRLLRKGFRAYRYENYRQDVRAYIQRVLGESPPLDEIYAECSFPAGASLGVHGNATNVARKLLSDSWSVTPSAQRYIKPALWAHAQVRDTILPGRIKCYDYSEFCRLIEQKVDVVRYNKVSFVPKTARTARSIAIEPLLNGYLQKGTDQYMRRRLKRVAAIDLSDQTRNQQLALLGSLGGRNPYATIDLSAASDSISYELVKELLPPDWFRYLEDIRSPSYMLNGLDVPKRYEKFASMGNGFCFPLESLIFAGITFAACKASSSNPYDFSVYGDDIIVRQGSSLLTIELLQEMGFKTNVNKTFIHGPFRESCGQDWYAGQDVRPVHLDERLLDLRQLFAFHNATLRSPVTEIFFEDIRQLVRFEAPRRYRYLRPGREPGDTCFSTPVDVAVRSPDVIWNRQTFCWKWKEIRSLPTKDSTPGGIALEHAKWLAIMAGSSGQNPLTLRYSTRPKITKVSRWNSNTHHGLSWDKDELLAKLLIACR